MDDDELTAAVLNLLADLRPVSRYHLVNALLARSTDGVTGTLLVRIPRKGADAVDVGFLGADVRLGIEL